MTSNPRTALRRQLAQQLRTPSELDAFLSDYFPSVYQNLPSPADQNTKITRLFESAHPNTIKQALRDLLGESPGADVAPPRPQHRGQVWIFASEQTEEQWPSLPYHLGALWGLRRRSFFGVIAGVENEVHTLLDDGEAQLAAAVQANPGAATLPQRYWLRLQRASVVETHPLPRKLEDLTAIVQPEDTKTLERLRQRLLFVEQSADARPIALGFLCSEDLSATARMRELCESLLQNFGAFQPAVVVVIPRETPPRLDDWQLRTPSGQIGMLPELVGFIPLPCEMDAANSPTLSVESPGAELAMCLKLLEFDHEEGNRRREHFPRLCALTSLENDFGDPRQVRFEGVLRELAAMQEQRQDAQGLLEELLLLSARRRPEQLWPLLRACGGHAQCEVLRLCGLCFASLVPRGIDSWLVGARYQEDFLPQIEIVSRLQQRVAELAARLDAPSRRRIELWADRGAHDDIPILAHELGLALLRSRSDRPQTAPTLLGRYKGLLRGTPIDVLIRKIEQPDSELIFQELNDEQLYASLLSGLSLKMPEHASDLGESTRQRLVCRFLMAQRPSKRWLGAVLRSSSQARRRLGLL